MRCDICKNFEGCETLRELKYVIDRMDVKQKHYNIQESLYEDLYILIAKFCQMYHEE